MLYAGEFLALNTIQFHHAKCESDLYFYNRKDIKYLYQSIHIFFLSMRNLYFPLNNKIIGFSFKCLNLTIKAYFLDYKNLYFIKSMKV